MKEKFAKAKQNIVIDLDFDDIMTPAEKQSMVKQMRICYAVNKKAKISTRLHLTSMNGKGTSRDLREKIDGFENWQGIYTHDNSLPFEIERRGITDNEASIFFKRKKDLVYLTADSPFEISTLNELLQLDPQNCKNRYPTLHHLVSPLLLPRSAKVPPSA